MKEDKREYAVSILMLKGKQFYHTLDVCFSINGEKARKAALKKHEDKLHEGWTLNSVAVINVEEHSVRRKEVICITN